jgi:hypothetical protein
MIKKKTFDPMFEFGNILWGSDEILIFYTKWMYWLTMSGDRILSELHQNQIIGQMIDTWCRCNEKGYLSAKIDQ